jgi:hypothetical protein
VRCVQSPVPQKKKKNLKGKFGPGEVAQTCNPAYLGDVDYEDRGLLAFSDF